MPKMAEMFPQSLLEALREARRIAVLTGAGISAESGIPTFRDAQTGLWARYLAEDLATPEAFGRNPGLVWDWYEWRRGFVRAARPNPGHLALARMQALVPGFTLITQNVDGLHARAGSLGVIELHGNIMRSKCFAEGTEVASWAPTGETPPRCPSCGNRLRPDVVWFGEMLPEAALHAAQVASQRCEVFFSIGTSALVYPAARLPLMAAEAGAVLVEVNRDATPLTGSVSHSLQGASGEILPRLVDAAWPGSRAGLTR